MSQENKEIVKKDNYALTIENALTTLEQVKEDLAGLTLTFPRIKIPTGGGLTFEIPTDNPDKPDNVQEFNAVILYHHTVRAYYEEAFNGGNNPPDCGSTNGELGIDNKTGEMKKCETCPLNQFGSGKDGGKACKQRRRLYILKEGDVMPTLISIPTGSLKPFSLYVMHLVNKGQSPTSVITKFSLKKEKNRNGITYSQVVFTMARTLTTEEQSALVKMRSLVKAYAQNTTVEAEEVQDDDLPF